MTKRISLLSILILLVAAIGYYATTRPDAEAVVPPARSGKFRVATFAGGCFWCMEPPFDKRRGVLRTIAGYTGGTTENPTYEEVAAGSTGHAEAIQVHFDSSQIGYEELLAVYWRNVDPTQDDGQFCDHGRQYRSAIFYHDDEQQRLAERTKAELEKRFGRPLATEIEPAQQFYPAEEYHQDYYEKNPLRYEFYRYGCGRDERLKALWGEVDGK